MEPAISREPQIPFNLLVNLKAREGFRKAGRALFQRERGMTMAFNHIGQALNEEIDRIIADNNGTLPAKVKLVVRIEAEK